MRSLYFATVLSLATLPALAQQPDPAQAFISQWADMGAASRQLDWASGQIAAKANVLVSEYQRQQDELKKTRNEREALEARLATAMEWLKQAQTGDSK